MAVGASAFPHRCDVARLAIDFAGTCDLAMWCKLLRDRGWPGGRIAEALGRSEGYINNLVRIVERAALPVLMRWKAEQDPDSTLDAVCATDWLVHVCRLAPEQQEAELARRLGLDALRQ